MGYVTKQGNLVKNFLEKRGESHFSADEIYFALISDGCRIGKTTVYRQLEKLVGEGAARKFSSGDSSSCCYQLCSESCKSHYHLKCSVCGKLFHIECDFLDRLSEHIYDGHRFTVDGSKTVLYGICENCAKEK